MPQQVLDKGNIGRYAANTELAQGPIHPRNRLLRCGRPCRDFDQQRIVIARDHPARIGRAAIKTNAHARGAAIGGDAAIIGDKVVLRILCCDPRL